jgi:hypothetical protein
LYVVLCVLSLPTAPSTEYVSKHCMETWKKWGESFWYSGASLKDPSTTWALASIG